MKTKKIIIYNLINYITILNIIYLFFGEGINQFNFSKSYLSSIIVPFLLITILVITNFFVNYSYITNSAISKKNLLRISAIILMILLISSLIKRIYELFNSHFVLMGWINTILYFILLGLIISILKDLFKLLDRLFNH